MKADFTLEIDQPILSQGFVDYFAEFCRIVLEAQSTETPLVIKLSGQYLAQPIGEKGLRYLQQDASTEQVYQLFVQLRQILISFQNKQQNVICCIDKDCFGFAFEFALACHRGVIVEPEVSLGIPEVQFGMFPLFGVCEDFLLDETFKRKSFEQYPCRTVSTLRDWSFHFSFMETGAVGSISKPYRGRKITSQELTQELSEERFAQFSADFPYGNYEWRSKRPWYGVWNMVRDKLDRKSPIEFVENLILLNVRMLLSQPFFIWLERQLLFSRAKRHVAMPSLAPVVIDLEFLVPSVETITRLIESGFSVVLASSDVQRQKEALELLAARLERSFLKEEAVDFWQKGIFWASFEAGTAIEGMHVLRWYPDDQVQILSGGEDLSFLRFMGNRGNTKVGWAEISSDSDLDLSHDTVRLAGLINEGLILTRRLEQIKLSTVIRTFFLAEMIDMAKKMEGGMTRLLPILREVGWGYIADENSWEYFLRTKDEGLATHVETPTLGILSLPQKVWQLGLWKEAREISVNRHRGLRGGILLSHHFAMFAGLLVDQIVNERLTESFDAADILVGELVGFPSKLGSPASYVARKTKQRSMLYWDRLMAKYRKE